MKQTSTKASASYKKFLVQILVIFSLSFSQSVYAHRVQAYTTSGCAAGQNVTIDAIITNAPSVTRYSWQYKDGTGTWKCFVNGANTINGVSFTVSGAKGTGANNAPLLTISNATTALENVQIRVLMRENAEPCGAPSGTTWGGDDLNKNEVKILRLHIYTPASDCGGTTPGCIGNFLSNGSGYYGGFENKVYNSSSSTYTDNNFISGTGSTQYTISQPTSATPSTSGAGTAQIWNNPYTMNTSNTAFAPRSGNYQMIVHGTAGTQRKVWYKTVSVTPGATYAFSVWVARTQGSNAFNLRLTANGTNITTSAVSTTIAQWNQVSGTYTVPAGVTSMEIAISDVSTSAARYFSIDDICFTQTSVALGNRVWYDTNNNGIENTGENGIRNVTVRLYNDANNDNTPDGAAIATTTTDVNGNYLFSNLTAGNYIVGVVIPAGYMSSSVNGGDPDNNIDRDDNGQVLVGNEIRGLAITLSVGGEPNGSTNNTYDFGLLPDCACVNSAGNLLVNPSFENGTTGWSWSSSNGSLTTGTGYVACGSKNGFNNQSSGTARVWQDVNVSAGSTVTFKAFAGTHAPGISCSPKLSLIFLNSSNSVIGQTDVTVTRVVGDYNDQLQQYSITAVAPAGTAKVRVQSSITCNTMKLDALCLTVIPCNINAGTDGSTSVCANSTAAINLYSIITGEQTGGTWSRVSGTGGTFVASSGTFTPSAGATTSVFRYIVTGTAPCADTSFATVNIIAQPNAGTDGSASVCDTSTTAINLYGIITGEQSGGTWIRLTGTGGTFNASAGTFTPAIGATNSTFRYSVGAAPCTPATSVATVTILNCQAGSIGDRVWKDDNSNGIQDAGEVGVAGVTLVLLNSANQVIATTTTDGFGIYKFSNLAPGNYTLRVTPPANYSLSAKTQGANTNLDSDFDPVSYTTGTVTLNAGQNRTDIDAGLKFTQDPLPASVGDRVWLDINADGAQDAGEPGVSNVLVTLNNVANTLIRFTYTDVNGFYLFTDVTPGNYTVNVSLPPAFVFTANNGAINSAVNSDIIPATGRTATFAVNAGDQIRYVDAGLKTQGSLNGSIGDFVWNDINKNGIQETGEPGIVGVDVVLRNAVTSIVIAATVTDATGKYIFNDVPAGKYFVSFVTPAGHTITTKLNTNPQSSNTDSDVDPLTLRTDTITLAAGQRITTIDAGYWLTTPPGTGKIGDRVWYDLNQNGIQDSGEPDVAGITVTLYSGAIPIKRTVTNQQGLYIFTDLAAGNYTVGFNNIPQGFTYTINGAGTAATGSDVNPVTGRTETIILAAGQTNLDIDAGIRSSMAGKASVGNRVWYDLNNNGLQDAGELGVQGIKAELLDENNNPVDKDPVTPGVQPTIMITNALGEYLFTDLPAANYKVQFSTLPAGYNVVIKGAGSDRDIDSDGNPVAGGTSTTDLFAVAAGEERLDIDLGLFSPTAPLGQIGDRVWFDANNNGIQDSGEQGVPGVGVSLLNGSGNTIATTVTNGNGIYKFVNLANGTYSVQFTNLPAGFVFSPKDIGDDNFDSDADPVTGKTGTYVISGNTNLTVDAGIYSTRAALGDYVWADADGNGRQDATEKGIAGVTVILYNTANVAVTSTITDQNGRYFFSNLNPGTYTVGFSTTPEKMSFTVKDAVIAGDILDSDVNPATGRTDAVTLIAGEVNLTVDAGLKPLVPATIGDYVWFDANRDGLQGMDEEAVPGILVTLFNAANQQMGSAVTDGNGYYLISNVAPGTGYYLVFSNRPEPIAPWTLQNVGGANANDNSKADATGKTVAFSVSEGQHITNMDAGLFRLINIYGNVWNDANGLTDLEINRTGTQSIPNSLTLYLVDVSTNLIVQAESVNPDGTYAFLNVEVNHSYKIVLSNAVAFIGQVAPMATLPSGWQRVGENLGSGPLSGHDGVPNGLLFIDTEIYDVIDANFGIRAGSGEIIVG